jgi:hypothetical protein
MAKANHLFIANNVAKAIMIALGLAVFAVNIFLHQL